MRAIGIMLLLAALWGLGYGWLALAWDGGTQRVTGDWILIGLSALLGVGAIGMIARRRWGAWMAGALAVILFVAVFLAGLAQA